MIGIVVLAAGAAKRFGACKLTLPIDGVPLVRRSLLAALGAAERVVVVSGAHRERVEACVSDLAIDRVFNANWADGMGASIACGISALATACDAAIIALADQVLIGTEQFKALIAAHARAPERIIAAQYNGVLGAPCLFPRAYFEKLAALHGEHGARALLQRYPYQVDAVPMPNAALDIDTPGDYAHRADI